MDGRFGATASREGPWRVLVLDASSRQALAACRALGREGHYVGAAGRGDSELAGYSRYVRRYHRLPSPCDEGEPFLQALQEVVAAERYGVVIAVEDPTLLRLAQARIAVPTVSRLDDAFGRLTDKVALIELAARADVAYPETFAPADAAEVDGALAETGLPVVVKAARSAVERAGSVEHVHGATVASEWEEALRAVAALRARGGQPLVQRFVRPVERVDLAVVRRHGVSEVRFTCRVLRNVPLTGGIAMTLETISPDGGSGAAAVDALERICDAAGYEGVANAEFCRTDDGRLYLIEVNPRLWASSWFAELLGQQVTVRCVRHALGLPSAPAVGYPVGRRFHEVPGELRWVMRHERRREPLFDLLRTVRPRDLFEYQDGSDPVPILRYALSKARRRLASVGGHGRG